MTNSRVFMSNEADRNGLNGPQNSHWKCPPGLVKRIWMTWNDKYYSTSHGFIQLPPSQAINLIYAVRFQYQEFTNEESKSNNDAFVWRCSASGEKGRKPGRGLGTSVFKVIEPSLHLSFPQCFGCLPNHNVLFHRQWRGGEKVATLLF